MTERFSMFVTVGIESAVEKSRAFISLATGKVKEPLALFLTASYDSSWLLTVHANLPSSISRSISNTLNTQVSSDK